MSNQIVVNANLVATNSRCSHYNSELDIVAIKFKCCNQYFGCIHCHNENVDHKTEQWKINEQDEKAILCGNCKTEMSINTYLNCNNKCPNCKSNFNPKCCNHYHFYFEMEE